MSNDLPILYILDASVAVTGAFMSARSNARALKDAARMVLVLPEGHTIPASECSDFWRVEMIPLVNLSKRIGAILAYLPTLMIGTWRLRQLMKRDGAMRLQLNDFFLMHGALLRLFCYRGHMVTWVRCEPKRFAGPLAQPMLALGKLSSNRMVAVSSFIRSLLPAHYPVEVMYNFYTGATRAPRTWDMAEEKTFVYVGNYIQGKGHDMALEAFAIAAKQDTTLKLRFYGADMGLEKNRAYRNMLEAKAQQLGIASRVHFGGFIADTYPVLETAFAALNCSISESFSRTVLEASGAGLPIIATASGGPQEIIKHGVTGYIIPVGDATAAAEYMLKLARDPKAATIMGQAGAAHIQTNFTVQGLRGKLLSVLGLTRTERTKI